MNWLKAVSGLVDMDSQKFGHTFQETEIIELYQSS